MGHDKRYEKVIYLFTRKRFYAGLFILLPVFFGLFALGPFLIISAQLGSVMKGHGELGSLYESIKLWAYLFVGGAFLSGIVVAYALMMPARRLLKEERQDIEEFSMLGAEFKDMATSLRKYISTLESMSGGVIAANTDGDITMANRQASGILGIGQESLIGGNIRDFFEIKEELDAALRGNTLSGEEIPARHTAKEGAERHLMGFTISPIKGLRGIEGVVVNFRDITTIKEIHREIEKTERLASIGSLTMEVAHEVRNPLASIKGLAQLIGEDMAHDDPKRAYIDVIIKETERLNRVVENLYKTRTAPFGGESLRDMLHRAVLLSNEAEKAKGVRVTEDYGEEAGSFLVTDEGVFQGLYNIILNAYEAVPGGAEVIVRTAEKDGGIEVEVVSESTIKEQSPERLFEPEVTTKGDGRGIGLKIARDSISRAGGSIDVGSAGERMRFRIWLPGK
jgi:PAS domain S-box-containing protein